MRLFVSTLALAAALAAPLAQAQDGDQKTGFYVAVDAGIAGANDPAVVYYDAGGTFGGSGTRDTAAAVVGTDSAFTIGGTLGYDFGMIRADVELDYAKFNADSLTLVGFNGSTTTLSAADRALVCAYLGTTACAGTGNTFVVDGGGLRQLSAMGNVWLDFPVSPTIVPYVGGGIGIAGFEFDGEGTSKFAWQLGAGAAIHLSPTTALTLDFRHRETSDATIEYDAVSGVNVGGIKSNAFTAGLRFTF